MRCGGQGWCHCGRKVCEVAEWHFTWCLMWRLIAFEIEEQLDVYRFTAHALGDYDSPYSL